MYYLAQVILYTGLMSLIYYLILKDRPGHTFNRFYLLSAAFLPVFLPFISFPSVVASLNVSNVAGFRLPEFIITEKPQQAIDFSFLIAIVYSLITLIIMLYHVRSWYKIRRIIKNSSHDAHKDYTIVMNTGYGPGSWGKYILLPDTYQDDMVIQHEIAHVKQRHTIDILLLSLLQAVFWPNLFLLLLRKELVLVHEFQADSFVSGDRGLYAEKLVSGIFGTCTLAGSHSFIVHPIKRRIMMLKKNKRSGFIPVALALVMASGLLFSIIGLQSCKTKNWEVKREQTSPIEKPEEPLSHADVMPSFPGGQEAFIKYMSENVKYPKEAMEKKIEGRVTIRFIVDENGRVSQPEVKKSPDPQLSEAALATVRNMPAWVPGEHQGKKVKVYFTLPVLFKLS